MFPLSLITEKLPFVLSKRGGPLYLAVAVHAEKIQDAAVFAKLLEFRRALQFAPAAFVMTPASPIVMAEMEKSGITKKLFTERLKTLGVSFDIGLHGHYCRPLHGRQPAKETPPWLKQAGFEPTSDEPAAIKKQFKAEYEYLASAGYAPKLYCSGWWVLNETIVKLLDEYGFEADCSIRQGCVDSLGGRYLFDGSLPAKGLAFILPPSKKVVELPSIAYLDMEWWRLLKELIPMLLSTDGPMFAVLSVHDYNLRDDSQKILANISALLKIRNVEFVTVSRMQELARTEALV
jgi:hypothetical protein